MKFVKKKVRNILESNFFIRYLIHQTTTTNQNTHENARKQQKQKSKIN